MDKTMNIILSLLQERKIEQKTLADYIGVSQQKFTDWKSGRVKSYNKYLPQIADFFGVSVDYLLGNEKATEKQSSNIAYEIDNAKVHMIPVFESASAGFGAYADESICDYIPCIIDNEYDVPNTLCIRVIGDSMSPKIEDGDIIQVLKQSSVDSGSIAVVLIDNDEGYVKKVYYGHDWIELHSFNPNYPVMRFKGPEVPRINVVGKVVKIIRNV